MGQNESGNHEGIELYKHEGVMHNHEGIEVPEFGEGSPHVLYMPGLAASPWDASRLAPKLGGLVWIAGHPDDFGRVDFDRADYAARIARIMNIYKPPVLIQHSYAAIDTPAIEKELTYKLGGVVRLNPSIKRPNKDTQRRLEDGDFEPQGLLFRFREWKNHLEKLDGYLGQLCSHMERNLYMKVLLEHLFSYGNEKKIIEARKMFKRVYKCLTRHEAEDMQSAEDETQVEHRLAIRGAHDNWDDKSFKFSEKTTNTILPVGHYSMIEDPDGVADTVASWERERGIHWDNGAAKK